MKILIINYEYPPLGGGGGVFTRDLAVELSKNNEVDVLTSHFQGLAKEGTSGGVNIFRVPVLGRTSLHTATMASLLSFPVAAISKGLALVRKKKYDIISTHFAVPTGPAGVVLGKFSGLPNVLSVYGGDIYDPSKKMSPHRHSMLRWAVRTAINNSTAVIAESSNIRDYGISIYRPSKDISVIPLGIPTPGFPSAGRKELGLDEDTTYLVSIGRLVKRKGYPFLIEALRLLRRKGLNLGLILIGGGPEQPELEKMTAKLGLSGQVIFTGPVTGDEKFQYLSASDIYVLSSIHEGFGIVLLEAMFCGLPVVATNNGGQTEIVKAGRNALLVNPGDPGAIAEAVEALVKDPAKMEAMQIANLEDVRDFSISAVARKYENLFSEMISATKTREAKDRK